MNIEQLRDYCLSLPEATEDFPFDDNILVFKVSGKLFVLTSLDEIPMFINLKCDPELAIELREKYESVTPGYHMNKRLWNTLTMDGEINDTEIKHWIKHSYEEVVKKLPKSKRPSY
jgi:predicted DNA-binding protein (MmcQ/YjbR family)